MQLNHALCNMTYVTVQYARTVVAPLPSSMLTEATTSNSVSDSRSDSSLDISSCSRVIHEFPVTMNNWTLSYNSQTFRCDIRSLVSLLVLLCWKPCTATAASHRLAYGWAQVHNTKVGWLLHFFWWERWSSDNNMIFDNFGGDFQQLVCLSEDMEELAIRDSLRTDTQLQFTAKCHV